MMESTMQVTTNCVVEESFWISSSSLSRVLWVKRRNLSLSLSCSRSFFSWKKWCEDMKLERGGKDGICTSSYAPSYFLRSSAIDFSRTQRGANFSLNSVAREYPNTICISLKTCFSDDWRKKGSVSGCLIGMSPTSFASSESDVLLLLSGECKGLPTYCSGRDTFRVFLPARSATVTGWLVHRERSCWNSSLPFGRSSKSFGNRSMTGEDGTETGMWGFLSRTKDHFTSEKWFLHSRGCYPRLRGRRLVLGR